MASLTLRVCQVRSDTLEVCIIVGQALKFLESFVPVSRRRRGIIIYGLAPCLFKWARSRIDSLRPDQRFGAVARLQERSQTYIIGIGQTKTDDTYDIAVAIQCRGATIAMLNVATNLDYWSARIGRLDRTYIDLVHR